MTNTITFLNVHDELNWIDTVIGNKIGRIDILCTDLHESKPAHPIGIVLIGNATFSSGLHYTGWLTFT